MNKTNCADKMMRQTGIKESVVKLTLLEGEMVLKNGERYILTKNRIKELRRTNKYEKKLLDEAERTAPVIIVATENTIITVFRVTRRVKYDR